MIVGLAYAWYLIGPLFVPVGPEHTHSPLQHFTMGVAEFVHLMWWGLLLGIVSVGLMETVPQQVIVRGLSGQGRLTGIVRATGAGLLFDVCSHGILMIGMKLYERGASIGQTAAFLLASPWNSISLTIILWALIGWQLTLAFVLLSAVIGIITGWIFDTLVAAGRLPDNPARLHVAQSPDETPLWPMVTAWWRSLPWDRAMAAQVLRDGLRGSRVVLRWLLFGLVLAAAIRALVPVDQFSAWFGPTMVGVFFTVLAATIIEVCSEGSAPLAADLVTRADAPGNGFTFLMAGAATDYTEVMSLQQTTGHWSLALLLPAIAVPQTILIGILLNALA
ncbi:MAG: permease [Pseudomonadota bacterium]